jgi:hypothetical protein
MRDSNRPVPAAIDGRKWQLTPAPGDLTGQTDTRKARIVVPVSDTPTGRYIRNHELAHARITPAVAASSVCRWNAVSMEALQWSEDARVSTFLDARSLVEPEALTVEESDMVAKCCAGSERSIAGALLVNVDLGVQRLRMIEAFHRAGVEPWLVDSINDRVADIVSRAQAMARDGAGSRVRRPRRMPYGKIFADRAGFKRFTIPLAKMFDLEFPVAPPGTEPAADGETRAVESKLRRIKGSGSWGTLTEVRRPDLNRTVKPRRPLGRRFSDVGVVPTAIHRLTTDGSVFGTRRRVKGGTVLCDASGSMHYTNDDIERLLLEAPGSTIAFYSAKASWDPVGRIVIGAQGGRACTVAEVRRNLPGEENLIDGPALRWLARQPGPRFWITDGGVGGIDDFGRGGPCWEECMAICRAAGITVVPRVEALKR